MSLRAAYLNSTFLLSLRFQITKPSIFSRLLAASNSAKKWWSRKKKSFSNVEHPEVTANVIGPSFTSSKFKEKQLIVSSEESDADRSTSLKEILVEPEGVDRYSRTRTRTIAPVDYSLFAKGIEVNDEHSAIIKSLVFKFQ